MLLQAIAIDSRRENPSTIRLADESFQLGYIELLNNDFKTATERFKTVVDLENRHLSVGEQDLELSELGLATIDGKRGTTPERKLPFDRFSQRQSSRPSYVTIAGLSLLGDVLLNEGKPAEAERELRPAYAWFSHDTAMRPHTVMTYVDLAEAEKRLGRPVEAAKILAELRVHPK